MSGSLDWHEASVLMRIYAAGFASLLLLFAFLYAHAYRLRVPLKFNPAEDLETRAGAGWPYLVIAPLLWIHGSIFGRHLRLLVEKLAADSQ